MKPEGERYQAAIREGEGIEPRNMSLYQRSTLSKWGKTIMAIAREEASYSHPGGVLDRGMILHGFSRNLGDPICSQLELGSLSTTHKMRRDKRRHIGSRTSS